MTRSAAGERGSMTAFVAVVAIALVMVAGMAYDGGRVIAAQTDARSDASKAARAGAQAIDLTSLRANGDTVLEPAAAETAALAYLDRVGATGTVTVDGSEVTVTVSATQPMHILPIPDRNFVATATATAEDAP